MSKLTNSEIIGRIDNLMELYEETIRLRGSKENLEFILQEAKSYLLDFNLTETTLAEVLNLR